MSKNTLKCEDKKMEMGKKCTYFCLYGRSFNTSGGNICSKVEALKIYNVQEYETHIKRGKPIERMYG
jgi:hypothetical protein